MVQIDHVHFYVEDAIAWRDWFATVLGFRPLSPQLSLDTHTERVACGRLRFRLSSPRCENSPIAQFLKKHPPGVADVAFRVKDLAQICRLPQVRRLPASARSPSDRPQACIAAWGCLQHTLIEDSLTPHEWIEPAFSPSFEAIDHVVLNVAAGQLQEAVQWYRQVFGFSPEQQFSIATARSSLHSQVLVHPETGVQFPINEPTSENSQIQEFLDRNGGPGVQHIALKTPNILDAVPRLRGLGVSFLSVPGTYYEDLRRKPGFAVSEGDWRAIISAQVLADWKEGDRLQVSPTSDRTPLLLQTFTQPIFNEPTFFFEVIERRQVAANGKAVVAQGFGEGNFRALFEAVEREQLKRSRSTETVRDRP